METVLSLFVGILAVIGFTAFSLFVSTFLILVYDWTRSNHEGCSFKQIFKNRLKHNFTEISLFEMFFTVLCVGMSLAVFVVIGGIILS